MTYQSTLTADFVLDMMDTDDSPIDSVDVPYAGFVLHHPELGIFLGLQNGMAFWSNVYSAGATHCFVFPTQEEAVTKLAELNLAGTPERAEDVEIFATPTNYWPDLAAIGLNVADMAFNEPAYAYFASNTQH